MSFAKCNTCQRRTYAVRMRDQAVIHVDGPSESGGVVALQVASSRWIDGHSTGVGTPIQAGEVRLQRHYCPSKPLAQSTGFIPGGEK